MIRASAVALLALLARPVPAEVIDRLAVELVGGESPRAAAEAFERGCWRAAVDVAAAEPAQDFEHAGARWVRLEVDGPPEAVRCLNALERGRRGVDGTFQWFDRVEGGLVVPGEPGERVPLAVLVDPARALPAPELDPKRLEALANGEAEALAALKAAPSGEALLYVRSIRARGGPALGPVLEAIAKEHPAWRVRREAVLALDVEVALERVIALASADTAWEVRHAAVQRVGDSAPAALLTGGTERSQQLSKVLADRLANDPAWEVRREAIWQLPTAYVADLAGALRKAVANDAEPRVRAVALETLAGAGKIDRDELREALSDPAPALRAVAAAMLAGAPDRDDLPALWVAMHDDDRLVRIAASGLLAHVDDSSIGPALWALYIDEVNETDADAPYLARLLEALARRPFDELGPLLEARLASPLDPDERRLVARAFARVDPDRSLLLFRRLLQAEDPFARSIAADAAPDAPDTRARRLELLTDPDADVRASAVLGLCRVPGALPPERAQGVDLEPVGLGAVALAASARCGAPRLEPARWPTSLAAPVAEGGSEDAAFWPALAAIALLVASVLGIKLSQKPA